MSKMVVPKTGRGLSRIVALLSSSILVSSTSVASTSVASASLSKSEEPKPSCSDSSKMCGDYEGTYEQYKHLQIPVPQLKSNKAAETKTNAKIKTNSNRVAFLQSRSETRSDLFPVKINVDTENLPQALTMSYDEVDIKLRVDDTVALGGGGGGGEGEAGGEGEESEGGGSGLVSLTFSDSITETGWSHLSVKMHTAGSEIVTDPEVLFYASGYLEGLATAIRMSQFYANHHKLLLIQEKRDHSLAAVRQKLEGDIGFLKKQSLIEVHTMASRPKDTYWRNIRFSLFQLSGILDAYNLMATQYDVHKLSLVDLFLINSLAELPELMQDLNPVAVAERSENFETLTTPEETSFLQTQTSPVTQTSRATQTSPATEIVDPLSDAEWEKKIVQFGHCTALIKFTDKDLIVSHTTWSDYSLMTRVLKFYDFNLGEGSAAPSVTFSSYPGLITSGDNYFQLGSGLTVMDTTLELLDPSLRDKMNPSVTAVPTFLHLVTVNRISGTGADWVSNFQSDHLGGDITSLIGNSQYMVLDYNLYSPGAGTLPPNVLWVLETYSGTVTEAHDETDFLQQNRFWGSVNRPFFDETRKLSGFAAAEKSHGSLYSKMDNPRMMILKNSPASLLLDIRGLMTENNYGIVLMPDGPKSPGHDISARMDLARVSPSPNGGIDAKLTNYCLAKQNTLQAQSGPSHAAQKPFRWIAPTETGVGLGKELWKGFPHYGLPNVWNFPWVQATSHGLSKGIEDFDTCE